MKKWILFFTLALVFAFSGCGSTDTPASTGATSPSETTVPSVPISGTEAFLIEDSESNLASIALPDSQSLSAQNMEYIQSEIQAAVAAYSDDAFRLTVSSTDIANKDRDYTGYYLSLNSQICYQASDWVSITFTGLFNAKTAAHPAHLCFTLNFDPQTNTAIAFSDRYTADDALYRLFSQKGEAYITERAGGAWPENWDDFSSQICSREEFFQGLETGEIGFYRTDDELFFVVEMPHTFGEPMNLAIPLSVLETQSGEPVVPLEQFDIYELGTETYDSVFNAAMAGNPIDSAYLAEMSLAINTDDMVAVQEKYIDLWQAELERSTDAYTAQLSPEDTQTFLAAQALYLQALEVNYAYESNAVLNTPSMGSAARFLLPSAMRTALRERTIHVKYLHYLLERTRSDSVSEYSSLKFPELFAEFRFADYQDMPEQFPSAESFGPITDTDALLEKAEALWIHIYGEKIKEQQPYLLSYDKAAGVWLIRGTFPDDPNLVGGVANMLVENATGNVLAVWHEK